MMFSLARQTLVNNAEFLLALFCSIKLSCKSLEEFQTFKTKYEQSQNYHYI